jgi:alpha-amylase
MIRKFLCILLLINGLYISVAQAQAVKAAPTAIVTNVLHTPDWAKNAVIYEVNIRQYSKEGTFNAFTKDLPRVKSLGVDILWLMPVYPLCEENKKCHDGVKTECFGSHYAPYDFEAVNPKYGSMGDFNQLVESAHKLGLKVILDFVPNHTGWGSKWMKEHPEWYKKGPDGKITDPINSDGTKWGWTDVAQLDYDNPQLREAWMRAHEFWLKNTGIDGFREDVAGAVPTSYWVELRPRLDNIRPVFMLAEDENKGKEQFAACFDMNYGWGLHSLIKEVAKGKKPASDIYKWTESIKKKFGTGGWQMNFTQNHDENSWNGTERESFGAGGDCFTALCFMIEGMGLIYNGQEASLDKRLLFFNKDEIDWSGKSRVAFFKTLTDLKHNNHALWNGQQGGTLKRIKTSDDSHAYVFLREKDGDKVLCVFNLSDKPMDLSWSSKSIKGKWRNVFDPKHAFTTLTKSQQNKLPAFGYLIYSNK